MLWRMLFSFNYSRSVKCQSLNLLSSSPRGQTSLSHSSVTCIAVPPIDLRPNLPSATFFANLPQEFAIAMPPDSSLKRNAIIVK